MPKFKFSQKTIPIFLATLTFLAYGLLIPWLGFYWDDWSFAWIGEFLGPLEFFPAFSFVRPFVSPIFALTTSLIPPIPILWQIFGLLMRFLSVLALWWSLKEIWTKKTLQTLSVALLFLLFPGYSQQWVAFTHINQEWVSLVSYIFSFGLMARAFRQPIHAKRNTAFALFFLFWALFPTEYFVTLEPIRFLFIYAMVGEEISNFWTRVKESAKRWLPYFLLWMTNVLWLVYFYTKGEYSSYSIRESQNSAKLSLEIIPEIGELFYKFLWQIWVRFIQIIKDTPSAPTSILGLALAIFTFALLTIYLQNLKLTDSPSKRFLWASQAILIGVAGLLLGRIPSWLVGFPLKIGTDYDRLTIPMMLGTAFLVAGLLELLIKNKKWRTVVLSGILAFALGQQFLSANLFRRDWETQRNLLWQLSWRIPAMEEGTTLLTHELPMIYESDKSFTAPLNWIYAPDYKAGDLMPYAFIDTKKRLGGTILPTLEPDTRIYLPYRTVEYEGNTSAVIVFYAPKNGCLRVLDSTYANAKLYKKESHFLTDAIFLSDPDRVKVDAESPILPAELFGKEPAHEWCYFSTKAELARQRGNWAEVVRLGDEAEAQGFYPVDSFEWLPFIEGYVHIGNLAKAKELSEVAIKKDPRLQNGLCQLWARVEAVAEKDKVQNMQEILGCAP